MYDFEFHSQRNAPPVPFSNESRKNEEAVLQAVSGHALPVHCFGIDHAVNEAFLRQLACQQRGTSVLLSPNDDLVRPIAILGSRLSRPALTDLALDGGWELADTGLTDIHAGQVIVASMRAASKLVSDGRKNPRSLRRHLSQPTSDKPLRQ